MLVLKHVKLVAGDGVPQARAEVRGRGRGVRRGGVERGAPHASLVAFEGSDPVARLGVAEHRLAVCGDRRGRCVISAGSWNARAGFISGWIVRERRGVPARNDVWKKETGRPWGASSHP